MGNSPMGVGTSPVGASTPPTGMSKVRITHLLVAACAIAAPSFGFVPDTWADHMEPLAAESAGSMVVNIFWPQVLWSVKRAGKALAGLCSRGFDTVLGFLLYRVDRLRICRAEAERPHQVNGTQALGPSSGPWVEGPAPQIADDVGTA
ncbi:hypothetical protein ACFY5C_27505 [Streptomyces sp. NPDC012935]|uniref:hypothetical protein n=1 Tax=Streptomyces sp. NPDC012935 TaxID=3364857 RepID=UPI00368C3FD0